MREFDLDFFEVGSILNELEKMSKFLTNVIAIVEEYFIDMRPNIEIKK